MAKTVVHYDKELPEIPGRLPWEKPTQHLDKDENHPTRWRVVEGRRPSNLLLVPKIREAVDAWREAGYPDATEVSKRLLQFWFEEDHEVPGFNVPFRYWFCQREAIETLIWLVEITGITDTVELIRQYATVPAFDGREEPLVFQTKMDGTRQIRRWVPEREAMGEQELPPENLRRYVFKMATGSGKTWVMVMAVVWSYFHKLKVEGSPLSKNFLIIAPNVIVYQRLEKDFASRRIFHELPLIPPEWRGQFALKVILRGEATEPDSSGNLFLTNIQQLYESRVQEWTPENAVEALLGPKPKKDLTSSGQRSMLERVKSLPDLVVINDEAHHVHDSELAWSQSLLSIHQTLPKGLSLWLDFSATPKDQNGMYFPWTVVDYPLAQAVEDRIVKAPLIFPNGDDPSRPTQEPEHVTRDNIVEKYGYWIRVAVHRWKEHYEVYQKLGVRPVLFITAEKNAYADAIGEFLVRTKEFGFQESEVLVIHTDSKGEITQKDLERAREVARDIDKPNSKIKVIVSVLMLREGWDVRNVSVVLGLRPFTAKAEILPEQVIGRGLRLMTQVGPDRLQTLEVLGNPNLLKVLREQLESEGVGVSSTCSDPSRPVIIAPVQERLQYDIWLPITQPRLTHNTRNLSDLQVATLEPIYDREELAEPFRLKIKLEFFITKTEVHQEDIAEEEPPDACALLTSITNKVMSQAKLTGCFKDLYPKVREYVETRCFGGSVDLDDKAVRSHLARPEVQEGIAKYLASKIGELTVETREIEFEKVNFRLSETQKFIWRRNLPPLTAEKTVFNYVATYNDYEKKFAKFLDQAPDVLRFASLATTEQGESGTQFRVDYLKPSGAIGFYIPDWVVVQRTDEGEVNWIIETKGRVWEDTQHKDKAIRAWCEEVSKATGAKWRYLRVNQRDFQRISPKSFSDLVAVLAI
jgi:type III restriction enzyme